MPETDDELVTALQRHVGSKLRAVGHHEADAWTIDFMREDVEQAYGTDSIDDIVGDLVLSEIETVRQEDLYQLGSLRATLRLFDDGIAIHVPIDERSGYFVSAENSVDMTGREVVELVRRTVE